MLEKKIVQVCESEKNTKKKMKLVFTFSIMNSPKEDKNVFVMFDFRIHFTFKQIYLTHVKIILKSNNLLYKIFKKKTPKRIVKFLPYHLKSGFIFLI